MPSFIRLLASVIVLVVVESVVLGFPGINQTISSSPVTVANIAVLFIGLIVAFVVLKFGTQFSNAFSDAYKNYRTFTPVLSWVFQILGLWILYAVSAPVAAPAFTSAPYAYPLIFLLLALFPTMKVVMGVVHTLETPATKHNAD
jgi:hypothetical protein